MFARALVSPARARLLEERARAMRFSPTRSEEWLWRRLSGSKTGFAFRRQLVIGPHIVDFACTKVRLVVEVDGPYHEERARLDAARDAALGKLGWQVMRVQDHEVCGDLDGVVERIRERANQMPRDRYPERVRYGTPPCRRSRRRSSPPGLSSGGVTRMRNAISAVFTATAAFSATAASRRASK